MIIHEKDRDPGDLEPASKNLACIWVGSLLRFQNDTAAYGMATFRVPQKKEFMLENCIAHGKNSILQLPEQQLDNGTQA